ncbi:hypothetical protein AAU57_07810 [Nonlabens sp. YIK11]|uniref:PIN domain-containing protein n=1 Tax=Nonlabens sp. YIK11 TaxID=1453349 RepID=UPI0006DC0661|nr:PIN domain-containing protein [Nonlabens sp. YIK11]KQC33231.1 hypothetical protein AAU57_07810 [Nonlabens sp. YIK11]
MKDRIFVDSNIFIYLLDSKNLQKQRKAGSFLKSIEEADVQISTQVVKEFCNVMINKFKLSETTVRDSLSLFSRMSIADTPISLIQKAIQLKYKYQLQFYDSIIVAAALETHCNILYSEDMQHSQSIEGLQIINPFQN